MGSSATPKPGTEAWNTLDQVVGGRLSLATDHPPLPPQGGLPDLTDPYVRMARENEMQKLLTAGGRAGTFLTPGQSALAPPTTATKSVLGG